MHEEGPMQVLAGPGSGKTRVITYRVQYLIEHMGVHPKHILVITFTKAAALEMKERFLMIMQGAYAPCTFGTFHSIFFSILKRAYGYDSTNILAEEMKRRIIRELIASFKIEYEDLEEQVEKIINEIGRVKNEMIDLQQFDSMSCNKDIFRLLFQAYQDKLLQCKKIDFDDMLVECYQLLLQRPDILQALQQQYTYILIDEFQDINQIQFEVIKLLAKPRNNLFVVGDDDQSIYQFRGAKPEIMLGFQKDYPEAKTIILDINYRSSHEIVEGARRLISNNKQRYIKNIHAEQSFVSPICIYHMNGQEDENQAIIDKIRQYIKDGISYSDIAILYRTNAEPRQLIGKFMEYNIPFQMKDSIPNIYEHWIAQDINSYLHIALGSQERCYYLRIWNRPKRYLNRENLNTPVIQLQGIKEKMYDKPWAQENIEKLQFDLKQISVMKTFAAIQYIRSQIGYDSFLKEYAAQRKISFEDLMETMEQIQEVSKAYPSISDWFSYIEDYTDKQKQQVQLIRKSQGNVDRVTFSTMHSAKGLEYEAVFIIEANEGITPYKKATKPEEIEEERRMFYVAVTRAKRFLHIYDVKKRFNKQLRPSRFIHELQIERSRLKVGAKITHVTYGVGTILKLDDNKITIVFDKIGAQKTINLQFAIENGLLSC